MSAASWMELGVFWDVFSSSLIQTVLCLGADGRVPTTCKRLSQSLWGSDKINRREPTIFGALKHHANVRSTQKGLGLCHLTGEFAASGQTTRTPCPRGDPVAEWKNQ